MTTILEFDYETYSDIDLKKLGLDLYSAHPSTEALMAAYRIYESGDAPGDVQQWQRGDGPLHATVVEALLDPHVEKWGFNSSFERVITRRVLKIKTPYSGWRCGMVLAYMQSFVGGLDDVGKQMQLSTVKSGEGKRLINKFSMPQRITKANTLRRRDENTDPDDWQLFLDYNRQDVLAEHEIRKHLIKYPILADEWYLYEIDQRINDRGMPIDMQFVENAIVMSQHRKDILKKRMIKVIGADDSFNPNSTAQLLPWLVERGYPFQDLRKDTVKKVITEDKEQLRLYQEEQAGFAAKDEGGYLTREARAILKLRQQAARTADRKYTALKIAAGSDFRMRFCFQFAGASRTSRWAGRRFQPHNLTKTPKSFEVDEKLGKLIGASADYNLVCVTDAIRNGDEELLELLISEPLDALAGAVRSAIRAPDGYELHDCDLKSIESVTVGWLSGCDRLLQVFRDGKDPYIDFGMQLFKKEYEEVTKEERNKAKAPVLGCAYRLSGGELKDGKKTGLWGYAENMGIDLTHEECQEAVAVFRSGYPEIPKFWYALEEAIARTVTTGRPTVVGKVSFEMRKPYLCMVLPSGRRMYYYKPRITKEIMISPRTGNPYTKLQFSYMGKQQNGRAWIRVYSHGGKTCEQATQATARDLLKEGMIRAHEFGFNLIMHVHDALTALQRIGDNRYTAQALNDCMVAMIDWCPDMPFSASPDTFKFYRK